MPAERTWVPRARGLDNHNGNFITPNLVNYFSTTICSCWLGMVSFEWSRDAEMINQIPLCRGACTLIRICTRKFGFSATIFFISLDGRAVGIRKWLFWINYQLFKSFLSLCALRKIEVIKVVLTRRGREDQGWEGGDPGENLGKLWGNFVNVDFVDEIYGESGGGDICKGF